jgi:hypothetical protein
MRPMPSAASSAPSGNVFHRIHNSHMLASAWKMVRDRLEFLEREGLRDKTVKDQLLANKEMRAEYLIVYDMVTELDKVLKTRFSLIARMSRASVLSSRMQIFILYRHRALSTIFQVCRRCQRATRGV